MSYGMNSPMVSGGGKSGDKVPKGYKAGQLQQYTPEQMELLKNSIGNLGPESFLSKLAGGDQSMFAEMEAPALKQFSGLQGGLASRFSGMGMGGRKSSGFQNESNQAASDFAMNLQSQRMGLRNQAIKDLMGMSSELLDKRPYDRQFIEKAKPWWQEAATGFASGAGQGLGQAAGRWATGGI